MTAGWASTANLGWLADALRVVQVSRRLLVGRASVVVNFHHADRAGLSARVAYLRQHFDIVSLETALESPEGERRPQVALTFDDGYLDNYTHAYPVLRQEGVPATIFLVTDAIGTDTPFWWDRLDVAVATTTTTHVRAERHLYSLATSALRRRFRAYVSRRFCELPNQAAEALVADILGQLGVPPTRARERTATLSWEQVREMHAGGVEFGSHTRTHPILSRLPPHELTRELSDSRTTLEHELGSPVSLLAYPHGQPADVSDRVREQTRLSGYQAAFSTVPRPLRRARSAYMLPRVPADTTDPPHVFALRMSGLWPIVALLRGVLGRK